MTLIDNDNGIYIDNGIEIYIEKCINLCIDTNIDIDIDNDINIDIDNINTDASTVKSVHSCLKKMAVITVNCQWKPEYNILQKVTICTKIFKMCK